MFHLGLFLIIFWFLDIILVYLIFNEIIMFTNISYRSYKTALKWLVWIMAVMFMFISNTWAESIYQSQIDTDSFDIDNATETITSLQESINDIVEQLYDLDNKELDDKWSVSEKYKEIRKEIVNVIQDINKTTDYVSAMVKKISLYKLQIKENTDALEETRQWIDVSKEYIQEFSNFLYKLNNQISYENEIDDTRLITLSNNNIAVTLSNEQLVKSILTQFNDMMTSLDVDESRQVQLIKTLNKLKMKASENVESYTAILSVLNQKKNYLIQFMDLYKEDKLAEQKFSMIFDNIKDVYTAIQSIIGNIVKKDYSDATFDMSTQMELAEKYYKDTNAWASNFQVLAWPVYPIQNIQKYYRDADFEKENGIPFQWIQIVAEQWSPVYSAADWVVYYVSNNPGIWINWAMIVHPKWYTTVYLYLNNIVVEKWTVVRRWQLIWYSGWEPGTQWAWFSSAGPNLTFIVFKDWVALNPLEFLDLSVIENKDIIPDDYNIKYLNDKYARTIDISEVKFASWDTVDDRAESFLNEYGVWAYRQLAFWEDAVVNTEIDRDVVICIAFAESTLGRYLTTANNIWNVWNDDSGNRVSFSSALAWARSIADTLNNIHLWEYHTISQLSRYGNVDGKIYASSPINWQRNVTKCLSQIKWYYVPEDYPFRIWLNPRLTWEDDWIGEEMTYVKKVD